MNILRGFYCLAVVSGCVFGGGARECAAQERALDPNLDRTLIHQFPNASELRVFVDEDGVGNISFYSAGQTKVLLQHTQLLQLFTRSADALGIERSYEASDEARLVQIATSEGIYFFTQDGTFEQLPVELDQTEKLSSVPIISRQVFTHNDVQYMAVSVRMLGANNGETFLIREDAKWLRWDFLFHDFDRHQVAAQHVRKGILQIPSSARAIDLVLFDGERAFAPLPPIAVTGENLDPTKKPEQVDGLQKADEMFGDYLGDLMLSGDAFEQADEKAIEGLRLVLLHRQSGNPVLIGPSGVGKRSLIRTFFKRVRDGAFAEIPRTIRVYDMGNGGLEEDTKWAGSMAKKIKYIEAAARQVPIVILCENVHSQRGKGTHSNDGNDIFKRLSPLLNTGRIRLIGTDTPDEFMQGVMGDPDLGRLLTPIRVEALKQEDVVSRVRGWIEHFDKPVLSDEMLGWVYRTSESFIGVGTQPAKMVDFLESAFAQMILDRKPDQAPDRSVFERVLQRVYGAPPVLFDRERARRNVDRYDQVMDRRLVGAEQIKASGRELVRQWFAGVQDPAKPAGVILYTGPKGTGKSAFGSAFAEALELPLVSIEMNQFQGGDVHAAPKQFLRQVAQAVQNHSFCVVVLDEYEKASNSVKLALLKMLQEGEFSVDLNMGPSQTQGTRPELVRVRNVFFIITANAAQDFILKEVVNHFGTMGFGKTDVDSAKAASIDPEKLEAAAVADGIPDTTFDRVDDAVAAIPPTRKQFRDALAMHARNAAQAQAERWSVGEIQLEGLDAWLDRKVEEKYRPGMSNREAVRQVKREIRKAMSDLANGQGPPKRGTPTVVIPLTNSCERAAQPDRLAPRGPNTHEHTSG